MVGWQLADYYAQQLHFKTIFMLILATLEGLELSKEVLDIFKEKNHSRIWFSW